MSDIIKLEVLIAWPPTSKCQETIGILEEVAAIPGTLEKGLCIRS